ncbi:MAG TPA: hypothetical protein VFN41_02485 [Candidatus Limnocylindrales bacterium]|nr:hypothetical protein [Candidatus Limnocylindrales bacterium]
MVDVGSHARHDRFAIAGALGGGVLPSTVRTCPSCGALHRDLLSIQTAIRHAWTPRRPRDLRLSRAGLAERRHTLWRRLVDAFGSSRDTVTRPLALGLTSLGIAGLVLTNVPFGAADGVSFGGASAAASPEIASPASAPYLSTAVDGKAGSVEPATPPIVVISIASVAAGGTILGLRRVAARRRAVR